MLPVAIAIMAKAPRAGEVKTRLCPPLTPAEAAALHRCFLLDKIAQVRTLTGTVPALAFTPVDAGAEMKSLAPDFRLVAQRGAGLDERIPNVLADLLVDGHAAAIAVDSDSPTLPTALLQDAVDRMARPGPDLVLGPTVDGGYYLIGLRTVNRALFAGIPWSSAAVLAQTLQRAAAAGLETVCLDPWFDVDTGDDLARLRAEVAAAGERAPTYTRRFFALPPGAGVVQ